MTKPTLRDVTHAPPTAPRARRARWDPPGWLSREGKLAFRRMVLDLEETAPGTLARLDVPTLALGAELYAVAQAAATSMRGAHNSPAPTTIDTDHGGAPRKTPAWTVFNQAQSAYVTFAREYGLTHAARVRLELDTTVDLDDDEDDLEDAL